MNGFKNRLDEAKNNSEKLVLIFIFAHSDKRIFKRGIVKSTGETHFDFIDRYDGLLSLPYKYLIEITEWREK